MKEEIIKNLQWYKEPQPKGGQQVSMAQPVPLVLYSPDLDIRIMCGYHRSTIKNKDLIMKAFNKILEEI